VVVPLSDTAPEAEPSVAPRPLPRRMAVANQKGGVGKTTTAINLGAGLAELDYRTLIVDLDPQGNATTGVGVNPRNLDASMYDVIINEVPIENCIEATSFRNLFVAPASLDLAGAEIELVPAFSRELRLRRALEAVGDDYDFVLIDCPPSLGLLTVNGLAAAQEVLVPIQCEYYSTRSWTSAPSCSSCTTPARSWPTRSPRRCGATSATECAATSCPVPCGCRRPHRSANRSWHSIRRPGAPSPTASWPRR
jgi:hypothetical protein